MQSRELDTGELAKRAKSKRGKGDPEKLKRELEAIAGLAKVQEWLARRHIRVYLTKESGATYYDERNKIEINSGLSRVKQLVFLLHECGHVLVGRREPGQRFGNGRLYEGERVTFDNIVDVVDEEFEAWARGGKLAERLGVRVDEKVWRRAKTASLVTYIRWANKDRGYNDGDYSDMRPDPAPES
jgi:hypothetical protein